MTATYHQAGQLIRDARRRLKLSQAEVARKLHIAPMSLSRVECGHARLGQAAAVIAGGMLGLAVADITRSDRLARLAPAAVPGGLHSVRSHREIPAPCLCDWLQTFEDRKPSGWVLAKASPWCPVTSWHGRAAA